MYILPFTADRPLPLRGRNCSRPPRRKPQLKKVDVDLVIHQQCKGIIANKAPTNIDRHVPQTFQVSGVQGCGI